MLLTGNYRAITPDAPRSIKEAVHTDVDLSRGIYEWVDTVCQKMGADSADAVPFEKYANAAQSLLKPSSAARAAFAGAKKIERVDQVVKTIASSFGMQNAHVDETVAIVDARLELNNQA